LSLLKLARIWSLKSSLNGEVNDDSQIYSAHNGHGFDSDLTPGNGLRAGAKPTDRHAHLGSPYSDANAPNSNTH